jgi:hypothetical protein
VARDGVAEVGGAEKLHFVIAPTNDVGTRERLARRAFEDPQTASASDD